MAKRTKEEIFQFIRTNMGEDSDNSISLIEDIEDSFQPSGDGTDWKQRYEENDKAWRTRYTERFMGKVPEDEDQYRDEPDRPKRAKSFEELFK